MDQKGLIFRGLEHNSDDLIFLIEKLNFFDQYFNPQLSSLTELDLYAKKLLLNAYIEMLYKGDKFIGFYAVYLNDKTNADGYLTLIAVSNDYKGLGYGQYLLSRIIEVSKLKGFRSIKLEVNIYNDQAIHLYKKNGFTLINDGHENAATTYYMRKWLE